MKLSDLLMVVAVLLAPVVAVQVQKWLEQYRSERERQLTIFKTLMATRATGLSHDHVQELNLIDLEFQGHRFKNIRETWKSYLDLLGDYPKGDDTQARLPVWNEKKADLLANLLMEMGKPLGYHFDAVHVKKGIYLPEGHTNLETEHALIRRGVLRLLFGDSSLKMDVQSLPVDDGALQNQKELVEQWLKVLKSGSLPVSIKTSDDKQSAT